MGKGEKKLITFLEKHMILLAVVLVTGLAFLMRRQVIWYHSQDYIYYFDMHEGNVQSAVYYMVVGFMGFLSNIPLHGIKWLAGIADFFVAILCVLLCKKEIQGENGIATYVKIKLLLLYAGCLFAPTLYIRGSVWAQVDSVAFALELGALYLLLNENIQKKEKSLTGKLMLFGGVFLAGMGIALYPCVIVVVLGYGCYQCYKKEFSGKGIIVLLAAVMGCALICNAICGGSIQSLLRWMTYHPYTGQQYTNVVDWLWNMFLLNSYGLALISGVAAFRKKLPYSAVLVLQVAVVVCYGHVLGW